MKFILLSALVVFVVVFVAAGLPGYQQLKANPLDNSAPPHAAFLLSALYGIIAAGFIILVGFFLGRLR